MLAPDLVRTAARSEALADHGDRAGRPAGVAALVAGRADLIQLTSDTAPPIVAMVSGATVGAVLAGRRPRHPVGWLLLALALSLTATGAAAQYLTWGLLVRPGSLPAARSVALYYPAIGFTALTLIGFLLLLTPTGSLPSPHWRWWARGHGGRAGGPPAGGGGGRGAAGPVLPGDRRPLRPPRPRRGPAGGQPGRPGRHHPGRGRGRRLAGGTLPPEVGGSRPTR